MIGIKIICVGRLRERFYIDAAAEYVKRLSVYCKLEIEEIAETRISAGAGKTEIDDALLKEARLIESKIPRGAAVIIMCIEGLQLDSNQLSELIEKYSLSGVSRLCFVIGGSFGLHDNIKKRADMCLSMSKMTFPHHLARVMLFEQIYRCFKICEGGKYHK